MIIIQNTELKIDYVKKTFYIITYNKMSYIKDKYIDLEYELKEKQENLDTIYSEIAKLYDYIDENRDLIEIEYIFEKLADIQNYCK
jgi:hypothetical protein